MLFLDITQCQLLDASAGGIAVEPEGLGLWYDRVTTCGESDRDYGTIE